MSLREIYLPPSAAALSQAVFVDNRVRTTKYTLLSFFPIFLYEQFSKTANCFFLSIALLQQIPGINPTHRFATAIPLSFIIAVSGVKECFEDSVNGGLIFW